MQAFLDANFKDKARTGDTEGLALRATADNCETQMWFASTKSAHNHSDVKYDEDCFVFFGRETKGLPEEVLHENYDSCVRIPMRAEARSLNLANSVAIIIYEYHRQHAYKGLLQQGKLTQY